MLSALEISINCCGSYGIVNGSITSVKQHLKNKYQVFIFFTAPNFVTLDLSLTKSITKKTSVLLPKSSANCQTKAVR